VTIGLKKSEVYACKIYLLGSKGLQDIYLFLIQSEFEKLKSMEVIKIETIKVNLSILHIYFGTIYS